MNAADWKGAQHRAFGAWVDKKLEQAKVDRTVDDLLKDLSDGTVLMAVLGGQRLAMAAGGGV